MRGRKPTPTFLKALAGNPGHRPLNNAEPVPPGDLVAPPDFLSDTQKEIWRQVMAELPKGMLRKLDGHMLMAFVGCVDLWKIANVSIAKVGAVIRSPNGHPIQNPNVSIRNRQAELIVKLGSELGISPTSRSRIMFGGAEGSSTQANKFSGNAARRSAGGGGGPRSA